IGKAIRQGEAVYLQDLATDPMVALWRQSCLKRGYRCMIALPLKDENARTFGALTIYATEPNAFTPDEIRLLGELAGDLAFGIVVLRARDKRKRAEEEREDLLAREQAARALAEKATLAKDTFLAMVSHELRTPLTPVVAAVELLNRLPGLAPEAVEFLDTIGRNIKVEISLINDLLDLTRLGARGLALHRSVVDIYDQLQQCAADFKSGLDAKHLQFTLSCQASCRHVQADPVRLRQIFTNLLKNAVKFTPQGGRIKVQSSNPQPDVIAIEIMDTGIGMEPATIQRLFLQPFEQADMSITRRFGGMGLGLYLARVLVELHGGQISAQSPGLGQGSVFRVDLPCVPGGVAAVAEAPAKLRPPPPAASPHTVLLVEDNEASLRLLTRFIESLGYRVLPATSAQQALNTQREQPVDIIVSDLGLPDISGWELLTQIRHSAGGQNIPAVAVSGFGGQADIERSRNAGFSEHLVKPIDLGVLARRLRELMAYRN
ncbi:MAG: ATP-binding protein, partial [Phycisphaerae bacterium]